MSTNESTEVEGTDLEPRDARALTECMTVLEATPAVRDADGLYEVVSQSGNTYTVDAYGKSCTCPDACHNDHVCKHQRRVMFAAGMRPIPAWVNRDALDSHLGEHTTATPRVVATDGGTVHAPDTYPTGDDHDHDRERPADCGCWDPDGDLPCFSCWIAGHSEPNPAANE